MEKNSAFVVTAVLVISVAAWLLWPAAAPEPPTPPSKRYVDAKPQYWTCTVRQSADGCSEEGGCLYGVSASISCNAGERLIEGGCQGDSGTLLSSHPSGQGWACYWASGSTVYAYANCCT